MPTYDYRCTACNHEFEFFQPMKDDPLKNCPECGGEIKRLIGAGLGPIFKGTGFYQTDYKNNSSKGGNNSNKNSTSVSKSEKVKPAEKKGKTE